PNADREVLRCQSYSADSTWQMELEASFPYVETPDQIAAIAAVKQDMEAARPMDRLVCGDVGYGKTEVAVRAAFKTVMEGRQVGVLVPTTVLAQQHFQTFRERLAAFPVRVEMLSRFRSDAEQRQVTEELAAGTIDIVIGTHRLLQKDVSFKDLGLVVIDEEQRFGVAHKEHLKKMRREVDVLTLSATPIPRTLYMALGALRDMSTMETPAEERLPIKTYVSEFGERLVREAVGRVREGPGAAVPVARPWRARSASRVRLSLLRPPGEANGDCPPATTDDLRGDRTGSRVPDRAQGPRDPRGRQPAGSRTERVYGRRRVRPVCEAAVGRR